MLQTKHITKISLDESLSIKRSKDIESERATAIADLLHHNEFSCPNVAGPYHLSLSLENRSINVCIQAENTANTKTIRIPIMQFRGLIRDYFIVCENYYKMARQRSHAHIEAIDMGRRGLHDEAAALLRRRFEQHDIETDLPTVRRLFTLICVLHIRVMY